MPVLRRAWQTAALIASTLAAGPVEASGNPPAPRRIVSLNLCTDQILIDLVPRERIAALSHLAADPAVSAIAEKARGIPATRGEAESVLGFEPDLVLAGSYSTPATTSLLERIGRRLVKVPLASDLDGIRAAIRQVAQAVGEATRGEALLREFDAQLARRQAAPRAGALQPSALVYQVNGLASGSGSLADALLTAAGFANHARTLGLGAGGTLPLETLVANPPDLIVLTGPVDEYRTAVAENLRHPALQRVMRERATVIVPWRLWLCGTQHAAGAVVRLAAEHLSLSPRKAAP